MNIGFYISDDFDIFDDDDLIKSSVEFWLERVVKKVDLYAVLYTDVNSYNRRLGFLFDEKGLRKVLISRIYRKKSPFLRFFTKKPEELLFDLSDFTIVIYKRNPSIIKPIKYLGRFVFYNTITGKEKWV